MELGQTSMLDVGIWDVLFLAQCGEWGAPGLCLWSTLSLGCAVAQASQSHSAFAPQLAGHTGLSLPHRVFDLGRKFALIRTWTGALGQTFLILWA